MVYPVILFCYNRSDSLKLTIDSLSKNNLAAETELYVYSDAPSKPSHAEDVRQVRSLLKEIKSFKKVTVIQAEVNKGLAKSIIEGVTEVLKMHEAAIVLEDDLLTSSNFLDFMNASLAHYKSNPKVFSISGYSFPMRFVKDYAYENYFTQRGSSWGWATWKDRWEKIDWEIGDYERFNADALLRRKFNKMGSDMSYMLSRQVKGSINSWAIRWCYHQFKTDSYTVFPVKSKVMNIGFSSAATNTTKIQQSRFATNLDQSGKRVFRFSTEIKLDPMIIRQFISRYSIITRLKYKALGYIFK